MILPFALFGTGSGTEVKARSGSSGATETEITGLTGAFHLYRIDWRSDRIDFSVDGSLVATHPAIASGMRVAASDYIEGGPTLKVDWLRLSPYVASGTFTSRVFDAGALSSWGPMSWTADVPSGTSLAMQVRKGNTPAPDITWTVWAPVASSGATVGGASRFIQYGATLTANTAADQTPSLKDVGITCGACNADMPDAIADLGAAAAAGGTGGRTGVKVSWSAAPQGSGVAVYRKAFGDYPLYRADHGAAPAAPASPAAALAQGWTLTPVTAPGAVDVPPARGFWYYAGFVTNACGVTSAPSNVSGGALDYLLGDVSDGASTCASAAEAGDGTVSTPDLSALGANYGQSFPTTDDRVCLDVGPTVDYGLRSLPHPDGRLDFEDLVLYALNFEVPLPALAARQHELKRAAAFDALELDAAPSRRAGEAFDVVLRFSGTGLVHALSVDLAWDGSVAEFVGASPGALLATEGGLVLTPQPGRVDAAVLGGNAAGLQGDGELVLVRFRARADGDPAVRITATRARDAANHPVLLGQSSPAPVVPRVTRLGPVFPNPFHTALNVSFSLARSAPVRIEVLDLAGRVMRHLENGFHPAGVQVVTWDGRGDSGEAVPPGSYVIRFQAGEFRQTRWVQLIR
jgi:hypothetical protein